MEEREGGKDSTGRRRSERIATGSSNGKRKSTSQEDTTSKPKMPRTDEHQDKGTVDFTFAQLQDWMNGEFRQSINKDLDKRMNSLTKKVDATQAELKTHKAYVEKEIRNMKAQLEDNPSQNGHGPGTTAPLPSRGSNGRAEREDYHYWRSRRSAKIFPVLGETESELRESLKEFFFVKLNMPANCVKDEEIEQVRRVRLRRGGQNQNEILVLFSDIETRDRTVSYARNLAPFIDQKGKPTAGVRFDIPDHLTGVHKSLLQYGHALWAKHNKDPDFKRNIRYDDTEKTFVMDIKFPSKLEWVTVTMREP